MATHKAPFETHHHIVPVREYFLTLVALLILMIITVAVAEVRIPSLGPISGTVLNQAFALLIAVCKATLVVTIFMGVRHATQLTKFWALLGFVWLAFFSVMGGDYAMRKYENVQGWEPSHESSLPRTVGASEGIKFTVPPSETNVRPRIDR